MGDDNIDLKGLGELKSSTSANEVFPLEELFQHEPTRETYPSTHVDKNYTEIVRKIIFSTLFSCNRDAVLLQQLN